MLVSSASAPSATQTVPAPTVTSLGRPSTAIVPRRSCVRASIRDTFLSLALATQTEPSPTATAPGSIPTGTSAMSSFVSGSMTPTELGRPRRDLRSHPDRQSEDRRDGCKHESGRTGHQPPRRPRRRLDRFDQAERRACRAHELTRRAVAPAGVLGERAGEDGVQVAGELGAGLARRGRLLVHVRPEESDVGCPRERRLAGQALVEDAAERVQVGARVDVVPGDLLGRDVLQRADDVARRGDPAQRAGALGQAEVGEVTVLLAAGARDQDVRGLHVTVDEPLLVGRVQRLGNLLEQRDRANGVECAFLREQVSQIRAVDVAHGEEQRAVLLSRVEDRDDMRVVERGGNARLAQEALAEAAVIGKVGCDHLERHLAPEALFLSAIDRAHSSSADEPFDQVAREHAPDHFVGALPDCHRSSVRLARDICNVGTGASSAARAAQPLVHQTPHCYAASMYVQTASNEAAGEDVGRRSPAAAEGGPRPQPRSAARLRSAPRRRPSRARPRGTHSRNAVHSAVSAAIVRCSTRSIRKPAASSAPQVVRERPHREEELASQRGVRPRARRRPAHGTAGRAVVGPDESLRGIVDRLDRLVDDPGPRREVGFADVPGLHVDACRPGLMTRRHDRSVSWRS